jgi:hypothetical protein
MSPPHSAILPRLAAALGTWPGFAALLALYIAFHFALRLALSPTIGVDDVAEAIFAQSLQWSYYPRQPPLFTWMLWGDFKIFGVNAAAVAGLKYALVALSYVFFYLAARRMFTDRWLALAAALSPSLIYAVGWGVHVGFTNTVLLTAACAATFYMFLRLCQQGTPADYLGLGLALGIGLLSKWGYPAFAGSLIAAGLFQETPRRRLCDPKILLTLGVTLGLVAPFFLWGFEGAGVHGIFANAMQHGGHAPYLAGVASGLTTLVIAVTMFLAPLWILALAVFPGALKAPRRPAGNFDVRRLLEHFFLVMAVVVLIGVFAAGVTYYKSRWMHPVLILFPSYFFCLVRDAGYTARQMKLWALILTGAALAVIAARLAQDLWGPPFCGKCRLLKPYPELARVIGSRGFSGGTIVAGDEHLAGNFRLAFPDSRIATGKYAFYMPPPRQSVDGGQCLVVWDGREGDQVPPMLEAFLKDEFGVTGDAPVQSAEAAYRHGDQRKLQLDFMILAGGGSCR